MKKIISLFKRDYERTRQVYNEVVPGAEWVISGEGVATEKVDGTCCLVRDNKLYKRYDAKKGRTPPANWEPAQPEPDPVTGHWPGWIPVSDSPEDQWHREAWGIALQEHYGEPPPEGTYELIGPKVQGNPYGWEIHELVKHGWWTFIHHPPRTFDELRQWFTASGDSLIEGIVWHHPDGRMVKIKRKDFGLPWPSINK